MKERYCHLTIVAIGTVGGGGRLASVLGDEQKWSIGMIVVVSDLGAWMVVQAQHAASLSWKMLLWWWWWRHVVCWGTRHVDGHKKVGLVGPLCAMVGSVSPIRSNSI